jgi:hypothetical protein
VPATCSALSTRSCSSISCPISWIKVSTTGVQHPFVNSQLKLHG